MEIEKPYLFQKGLTPWNKGTGGCKNGHDPELYQMLPSGVYYCKGCKYENSARYREKNRQSLRLKNRAFRVDIQLEKFYELWNKEDGFCPICGAWFGEVDFVLDHNHETGAVRGILCYSCNTGLGLFKENLDSLQKAMSYCAERN